MKQKLKTYIEKQKENKEFLPDEVFIASLRERILSQSSSVSVFEQLNSFFKHGMFRKLLFPLSVLILALTAIIAIYQFTQSGNTLVSPAYAMEKIREQYNVLTGSTGILHSKTSQKIFSSQDLSYKYNVTYEYWLDQQTTYERNISINDNNTTYHIRNGEGRWNYASDTRELRIERFKTRSSFTNPMPVIPTLNYYSDLMNSDLNKLKVEEKTVNGEKVFILTVTTKDFSYSDSTRKFDLITEYTFSAENGVLYATRVYELTDGKKFMTQETVVQVLEIIPRTEELAKQLFVFDFEMPNDVKTIDIIIDENGNTVGGDSSANPPLPPVKENVFDGEKYSLKLGNWNFEEYDKSSDVLILSKGLFYIVIITDKDKPYDNHYDSCPEDVIVKENSYIFSNKSLKRDDYYLKTELIDPISQVECNSLIKDLPLEGKPTIWLASFIDVKAKDSNYIKIQAGYGYKKDAPKEFGNGYIKNDDPELTTALKEINTLVNSIKAKE